MEGERKDEHTLGWNNQLLKALDSAPVEVQGQLIKKCDVEEMEESPRTRLGERFI
jgi:hypothetical protein